MTSRVTPLRGVVGCCPLAVAPGLVAALGCGLVTPQTSADESALALGPVRVEREILQQSTYSCGLAALAIVLEAHGIPGSSEKELGDLWNSAQWNKADPGIHQSSTAQSSTSQSRRSQWSGRQPNSAIDPSYAARTVVEAGYSVSDLRDLARHRGTHAEALRLPFASITRQLLPLIVWLRHSTGAHFSVLHSVTETAGKTVVMLRDPSLGYITLDKSQFLRWWAGPDADGIALHIRPVGK